MNGTNKNVALESSLASRKLGRRKFIGLAGAGAATLAAVKTVISLGLPSQSAENGGGFFVRAAPGVQPIPDVEIALTASPATVSLFPGSPTDVWKYTGKVLRGSPGSLQEVPNSYLGPTIRVRKGQRVRIHFANQLPESSIIHWHGLHVPAEMDGHPRSVIDPGQSFQYDFVVANRAGTYWYHPHPDDRTGPQIYHGLAGLFLVEDDQEKKIGLPSGGHDISLVIQDRSFDSNNRLVYLPGGMMGGMMARMTGFLGDQILVNGRPDASLAVASRVYRVRLLNGSNSRVYKLAWDNGSPLTVIAADGGLLDRPVRRPYVTLAPAERVELLVDFRGYAPNSVLELRSQAFPASSGRMGMMGADTALPNGDPFPVLKVRVTRQENDPYVIPTVLTPNRWLSAADAVNRNAPRRFAIVMNRMRWTLNGRIFAMDEVGADETVRLNTTEIWEFANNAQSMGMMGGMAMMGGMGMAHPMHIHGGQFQVIGRSVDPVYASQWETLAGGFINEGWKDTVLVMPGETVRLLVRFEDYPGVFLYHCHNLEHEDMGMMRNFQVLA